MSRRVIGIYSGAVLLLLAPLGAIPALWQIGWIDRAPILVPVLSLTLAIAGVALTASLWNLVQLRNSKTLGDELVERLFKAVHETADAVFITDRAGIIEYVNPAFERTTGFSRDEVIGQTPKVLKSGEQGTEYYANLWKTVLAGAAFQGSPINRRRDGTLFHAEQTITPMTNSTGEITHFVSVMRDMTDRRMIEAQEIEMRLAASIQRRLLPQEPPQLQGWELAGSVQPALATCGDYFDFVTVRDDHLYLVVADACGHGVGPALIAVQTRAHLRSLGRTNLEPGQILAHLDHMLGSDLDDGLFVTMALVGIDATTGSLAWASAGHPASYVFDAAGVVKSELRSTGLPLGMLVGHQYQTGAGITVLPGEVVLMVTDGFLEAQDPGGEEFGADRVCDVVRSNVTLPVDQIMRRLYEAVRTFCGGEPQEDDLTAVICRRIGGGASEFGTSPHQG